MHTPRTPSFLAQAQASNAGLGTPSFITTTEQTDSEANQQEATLQEHMEEADAPSLDLDAVEGAKRVPSSSRIPATSRRSSSVHIQIPTPPPQIELDMRPVAGPAFEATQVAPRLDAAILLLRRTGEALAEQARSDALEIGFQVAQRVIGSAVAADIEPLIAFVKDAVARAGDERVMQIHLNPDDVTALQARGESLPGLGLTTAHIDVVSDDALERGDCLLQTQGGQVDGRLQSRLLELQQAARRALDEQNAAETQGDQVEHPTLDAASPSSAALQTPSQSPPQPAEQP